MQSEFKLSDRRDRKRFPGREGSRRKGRGAGDSPLWLRRGRGGPWLGEGSVASAEGEQEPRAEARAEAEASAEESLGRVVTGGRHD